MKKTEITVIAFLVSIIIVSGLTSVEAANETPAWIKGVADFWVKGKISEQEFLDAIQYLVEKGILKIELLESLEKQVRELQNDIELLLLENQESISEKPDIQEDELELTPLTLVTHHYTHVYTEDPYKFTVRVYDFEENPMGNFYQNWGYLSGVNVTATIFDSNDQAIESFHGVTGDFGHFSDGFLVPWNFKRGMYTTHITVDENELFSADLLFHVLSRYVPDSPPPPTCPSPPGTGPCP